MRGILGNTAWLGLLQLAYYILPLFTVPVVTRAFGPELFGFVVTASAGAAFAVLFISFGFSWSGPRLVARHKAVSADLSRDVSAILAVQLIIALFCAAAYFVWTIHAPNASELRSTQWAILGAALVQGLVPAWLFLGLERMRDLVVPQLLARTAATIAIFLTIRGPDDLLTYALINLAGAAVGLVLFLHLMWRIGIRAHRPSLALMRKRIAESAALFVSNAAVSVYTTANVLIVSYLMGNQAAGLFGLADRLRMAVTSILGPMTQAIYPFVCRTVGSTDPAERLARRRIFQIMILTGAAVSAALFVGAPFAVDLLGGPRFKGAVPLVRIFSLVPFTVVLSNILGVQILLPWGKDRQVAGILVVSAVSGVLLQILLGASFGLHGSAWAYVIVELGVTLSFGGAVLRKMLAPAR